MFVLDVDRRPGTVYLVGAGPGDPDLITVKGLRLLRNADAVLYDALANESLLDEAPAWCERIFVGKRAGRHAMAQEQINALLVRKAREHRTVVRLKGGDPFVFGRGGEEMLYLQAAGVPVEVVPGISSAIAAPAAAGVPVTQRGVSSSVAIVSGHACQGDEGPDWPALARMDTVVILMGLGNLAEIAGQLVLAGCAPHTPAMAVARGTTSQQQVVVATLATLAQRVADADLPAPATVVVGEVVALASQAVAALPLASPLFSALPVLVA